MNGVTFSVCFSEQICHSKGKKIKLSSDSYVECTDATPILITQILHRWKWAKSCSSAKGTNTTLIFNRGRRRNYLILDRCTSTTLIFRRERKTDYLVLGRAHRYYIDLRQREKKRLYGPWQSAQILRWSSVEDEKANLILGRAHRYLDSRQMCRSMTSFHCLGDNHSPTSCIVQNWAYYERHGESL